MTFDADRARKVDLIMLPSSIDGTNCGNCTHFDKGYCKHPKVKMNVNKKMCCYYWARPDAPRAEESMLDRSSSRFRAAVKLRDRLGRELRISRFEQKAGDCGHDDDGDFSKGNICASLRKDIAAAEKAGMLHNMSKGFKNKLERRLYEVNKAREEDPDNEELANEENEIHDTLEHLNQGTQREKSSKSIRRSMGHLKDAAKLTKQMWMKKQDDSRIKAIHKTVVSAFESVKDTKDKNVLKMASHNLRYAKAIAKKFGSNAQGLDQILDKAAEHLEHASRYRKILNMMISRFGREVKV